MRPPKTDRPLSRLAQTLKEIREQEFGATQQRFAEYLGLTLSTLAMCERDARQLPCDVLRKLYHIGCTAADLHPADERRRERAAVLFSALIQCDEAYRASFATSVHAQLSSILQQLAETGCNSAVPDALRSVLLGLVDSLFYVVYRMRLLDPFFSAVPEQATPEEIFEVIWPILRNGAACLPEAEPAGKPS